MIIGVLVALWAGLPGLFLLALGGILFAVADKPQRTGNKPQGTGKAMDMAKLSQKPDEKPDEDTVEAEQRFREARSRARRAGV